MYIGGRLDGRADATRVRREESRAGAMEEDVGGAGGSSDGGASGGGAPWTRICDSVEASSGMLSEPAESQSRRPDLKGSLQRG